MRALKTRIIIGLLYAGAIAICACKFTTTGDCTEDEQGNCIGGSGGGTNKDAGDTGGKPPVDAGTDAEKPDAPVDAPIDSPADAPVDAPPDVIDAGPSWPTCLAGAPGTVKTLTISAPGVSTPGVATGYIWSPDGTKKYFASATAIDLTGLQLPAIAVVNGNGGVGFKLEGEDGDGGTVSVVQPWSLVQVASLPSASCSGSVGSETCEDAIGHGFRCVTGPFSTVEGSCPTTMVFVGQVPASSYSFEALPGDTPLAIDLVCPPGSP